MAVSVSCYKTPNKRTEHIYRSICPLCPVSVSKRRGALIFFYLDLYFVSKKFLFKPTAFAERDDVNSRHMTAGDRGFSLCY